MRGKRRSSGTQEKARENDVEDEPVEAQENAGSEFALRLTRGPAEDRKGLPSRRW